MSYWSGYYYKPYESVDSKKEKAEKKLAKLQKKNPNIQPVNIEGKQLATTWWGKAWNKNLESYADFSNRIERGRSYVRHKAVLDLKISSGSIEALVLGSRSTPYRILIKIKPLPKEKWEKIQLDCQGKFESLQELWEGKFPKNLGEIFTAHRTGLFPSPKEISMDCSCPDQAYMCKHIAAALYGVGARLDKDPSLFFKLRKVKMDKLIRKAIQDKKLSFLEKARQKTARVIADSDLSSLFGIEMEDVNSFIENQIKKGSSKIKKKEKVKILSKNKITQEDKVRILSGFSEKKTKGKVKILSKKRKNEKN